MSLLTPIIYFGYNVLLPIAPFIQPGDVLYALFDVKLEVLLQFCMSVIWISGAMAYFEDMAGRGACQFDSYYHYAMPSDFNRVCDLRELVWPFCFAGFGVQAFMFLLELALATYIFLFLDQEVLNEPHYKWGRRAYDFQKAYRPVRPRSDRVKRAERAAQAHALTNNEKLPRSHYTAAPSRTRYWGRGPNYPPDGYYYDAPPSNFGREKPYRDYPDVEDEPPPRLMNPYDGRSLVRRRSQAPYDDEPAWAAAEDERDDIYTSGSQHPPSHRSRISLRRGQHYSMAAQTPMEGAISPSMSEDSLHEAGPFVGPVNEPRHAGASRGYGGIPVASTAEEDTPAVPNAPGHLPARPSSRRGGPSAAASLSGRSSRRSLSRTRGLPGNASPPNSTAESHRRGISYSPEESHRRGISYASEYAPSDSEDDDMPHVGRRGQQLYEEA